VFPIEWGRVFLRDAKMTKAVKERSEIFFCMKADKFTCQFYGYWQKSGGF
jgi:hypothetical protein